ncbi:DciA family protein [Streptomyces sp. NPDC093589]|uniref:DciA family protein n=1 Tax=Streptomyces sp. NPDC093589 TaxID=3366043 RepID=UPI0038064AD7
MSEQQPTPAGPDLARQALASWKAAAKSRPAAGATKPRKKRRAQYGDGRDPVGLGSVLGKLGEENEWRTGVQGGSLTDQWPDLCPELVGHVEPAGLNPATGQLDLRPGHNTAATQLRWLGPQLVTRLQSKGVPVQSIRVLRVGPIATPAPAVHDDPAPEPEEPINTPAEASPGYRAALDAHRAHVVTSHGDPALLAAIAAVAGRPSRLRERPEQFTDAVAFREDLEEQAARSADARERALAAARAEKIGRGPVPPTVFQQSA